MLCDAVGVRLALAISFGVGAEGSALHAGLRGIRSCGRRTLRRRREIRRRPWTRISSCGELRISLHGEAWRRAFDSFASLAVDRGAHRASAPRAHGALWRVRGASSWLAMHFLCRHALSIRRIVSEGGARMDPPSLAIHLATAPAMVGQSFGGRPNCAICDRCA